MSGWLALPGDVLLVDPSKAWPNGRLDHPPSHPPTIIVIGCTQELMYGMLTSREETRFFVERWSDVHRSLQKGETVRLRDAVSRPPAAVPR